MQESPVHAVKEIPANAGMTVIRTTLNKEWHFFCWDNLFFLFTKKIKNYN